MNFLPPSSGGNTKSILSCSPWRSYRFHLCAGYEKGNSHQHIPGGIKSKERVRVFEISTDGCGRDCACRSRYLGRCRFLQETHAVRCDERNRHPFREDRDVTNVTFPTVLLRNPKSVDRSFEVGSAMGRPPWVDVNVVKSLYTVTIQGMNT